MDQKYRAWTADGSIWSLVAANALAIAVALHQHWGIAVLMMLYWSQSVVIGMANVFRILNLDRFSTERFTINNEPVDPSPQTKRRVAAFFALHYGIFHLVYLLFIVGASRGEPLFTPWLYACTAAFALNHLWSYRYNRDLDRKGTPNIGTLMFIPYIRIIPMHATILLGGLFVSGAFGLLVFGVLKTAADLAMHIIGHQQIKKIRELPAEVTTPRP